MLCTELDSLCTRLTRVKIVPASLPERLVRDPDE